MKRIAGVLALLLLTFQFSSATGIEWSSLSLEKALKKAKSENKLVFIDVFATWCGPCKYLDKKVFPDEALGEFMNKNFISLEIDGERGEGPGIMTDFALEAFPSLLFLDAEGNLLKKQVGAMAAEDLLRMAEVVVDPSSSPLYKLGQRFEKGDRDREFLTEYMLALAEDGQAADPVAQVYLESYPELNMDRQGDFLAFIFGIDELDHPQMKLFLDNIVEYIGIDPNLSAMKIDRIFEVHMKRAVEAGDVEIGLHALRTMYPALTAAMEGDIAPIEEAEVKMREALEEMMAEGQ